MKRYRLEHQSICTSLGKIDRIQIIIKVFKWDYYDKKRY